MASSSTPEHGLSPESAFAAAFFASVIMPQHLQTFAEIVEIGRHLQRLRTESRWQRTIISEKTQPFSKDRELSKDMEKQLNVRLFEKTKWVCLEKEMERKKGLSVFFFMTS
jgi:hypothetical protein